MPRTNLTQQDFSLGEISPKIQSRSDAEFYKSSVNHMQNYLPKETGSAEYRTGSAFAAETHLNKTGALIPFIQSNTTAYMLEFTNLKFRVYKKDGEVVTSTPVVITGITKASPAVVTSVSHGFTGGEEVFFAAIIGMEQFNNRTLRTAATTANTFQLIDAASVAVDSSGYDAYVSGGTAGETVTVTTPYAEADLDTLKFAQTEDTMYIVHPTYEPRKLTRSSDTAWTIATYTRTAAADPFGGSDDFPSANIFYEQRLLFAGTNNDPAKIWSSKSPASAGDTLYDNMTLGTGDTDAFIFNVAHRKTGYIKWLASTTKSLIAGTTEAIFNLTAAGDAALAPSSPPNVRPITFFGSADISPVQHDNDVFFVQRNQQRVSRITFDFLIDSFKTVNQNILASHIARGLIKRSAFLQGEQDSVWHCTEDGKFLSMFIRTGQEIPGWSRHETNGEVVSIASLPRDGQFDQLWVIVKRTVDGADQFNTEYFSDPQQYETLIENFSGVEATDEATYERVLFEKQKRGFFVDSGIVYDGSAQTVTMTPAATTGDTVNFTASGAVFLSTDVDREIWEKNGTGRAKINTFTSSTVVVCQITSAFASTSAIAAGDWYLTTATVGGLIPLEGTAVKVVRDGAVDNEATDQTVSNGKVTLQQQASYVVVGFGYTGIIKGLNLDGGAAFGSAIGKPKNVDKLAIFFKDTLGVQYGTDPYNLSRVIFTSTNDIMGRPSPLFTGTKVVIVEDIWRKDKYMHIIQDQPLPCTVQQISPYLDTNET